MSFQTISLTVYFIIIGLLSLCGLHRYMMLYLYFRHRKESPQPASHFKELPLVTIQLPFYNELYVAERAIEHVCRMRYPKERMEIQVLDDSTDETTEICRRKVLEYQNRGFDIELYHRDDRTGYKAGALKRGLESARGEFVAIFDADFVPPEDILDRMIHYFTDPKVGVVQSRWGHINRGYSFLTQIQSILLDGHFVVEQTARNRAGRFFNFNGTAGIWRRQAIEDAGGWDGDTLTEDLDLSFRAQLAGYRFVFLRDLVCPAELPVDMNAFKSQQRRWVTGHCQVGRKLLGTIVHSKAATFEQKVEACFQLLMVYAYPCVVLLMMLMLPMISTEWKEEDYAWLYIDLPIFLAATTSVWSFYFVSQKESDANWPSRIIYLPFVISIGIGIALSNTRAIFEGLFGRGGEFVRTPKYGVRGRTDRWLHKRYDGLPNLLPVLEIAFGLYLSVAVYNAIVLERYLSIFFLILFQFGFLYVGCLSLAQPLLRSRYRRGVQRPVAKEATAA
ncbi:MAG: glycosyltransferase [Planctomycetes bacterium]|nr:glycosyltransferase [Planctomycetota bacterium]